jgi:hypothetical protein
MIWSEELSARLAVLWKDNSASEITSIFNAEGYDITRNSIIGRLHRMKLSIDDKVKLHPATKAFLGLSVKIARRKHTAGDGPLIQAINRGPKTKSDHYKPKTVKVISRDILLVDLEPNECRFACNETGGRHLFCGHPTKPGRAYCEMHHALCWNKPAAKAKQSPIYREERRRAA